MADCALQSAGCGGGKASLPISGAERKRFYQSSDLILSFYRGTPRCTDGKRFVPGPQVQKWVEVCVRGTQVSHPRSKLALTHTHPHETGHPCVEGLPLPPGAHELTSGRRQSPDRSAAIKWTAAQRITETPNAPAALLNGRFNYFRVMDFMSPRNREMLTLGCFLASFTMKHQVRNGGWLC